MTPKQDAVTGEQCDGRHRRLWGFIGVLLTFLAVLVATGSMAAMSGMRAERRIDVHEARQQESQVAMEATLKRLEAAIEKQQGMIEDLWKKSAANPE